MSNFQERLTAALSVSALNKGDLATETGVALSTVSRWFKGTIPKTEKLEEVANALSVNAKWLLTGQGNQSTERNYDPVCKPDHSTLQEEGSEYLPSNNHRKMIIDLLPKLSAEGLSYIAEQASDDQPLRDKAIELARKKLTELNQS